MTDKTQNFQTIGKKLPGNDEKKAMADWIMADNSRHAVTFTYLKSRSKPDRDVHYVVRHSDVMSLLSGANLNDLDLNHYDNLMASATKSLDIHPQQFLLGAPTDIKEQRWEMLKKALSCSPAMDRRNIRVFDDMAKRAVDKTLDLVKSETGKNGSFNAIRDYGYYAACQAGLELTGMSLPNKKTLILRGATWFRNRGKEHKVILTDRTTPPSLALLWSQAIFGQAFSNVDDRSGLLRFAAGHMSKAFLKQIRFCMSDDYNAPAGSLIDRFKAVRKDFPDMDEAEFEHNVAGVVYEFVGTVIILAGTSFGNILATINENNMSIREFLDRLGDPDQHAIDEALRLNPTTGQLYRTVIRDFDFHGTKIKSGDLICCMLNRTMRDPAVFPDPDTFSDFKSGSPKRDILDFLNFGPNESKPNAFRPHDGKHPCFGQYWARNLLQKMLEGLTELKDLEPTGKMTEFAALPDAFPMRFTPLRPGPSQEKSQGLYTVCSEIKARSEERVQIEADILKLIEGLNNPADEDMRSRLLDTGCIHFMSMNVIPGAGKKEPSYLVLEMSADGDEETVIEKICQHAGERLSPIYEKAGAIKNGDELLAHMRNHAVELTQSMWPEFFSGKRRNGLAFNGTPGLTVERIRAEETLAGFTRDRMAGVDKTMAGTSNKSALQILETVRAAINTDDLEQNYPEVAAAKWTLDNSDPPAYAETSGSAWLQGGGLLSTVIKMFPRTIMFYFGLVYLGVAALISLFFFGQDRGPEALCNNISACDKNINLLENPIDLVTLPAQQGQYYIFNNPANIAFGVFWALVFAVVLSTVFALWRRVTGGFFRHGFKQMGAIFWLVLGLVLVIILQSLSPFFPAKWPFTYFDKPGLEFFYMPPAYWIGIAVASMITIVQLVWSKRLRIGQVPAVATAAFLMITTLVSIARNQIRIMLIDNSDPNTHFVLNRLGDAGLDQLIFYPLFMAAIAAMAIYAFNLSFPKLNPFRKMRHYLLIFAAAFLFIFVTSFVSWTEITSIRADLGPLLKKWVILPLLAAFIILCGYFGYNSYLVGRRFTYSKFFRLLFVTAAFLALLGSLQHWASRPLGEHMTSFVLAIPLTLMIIGIYLSLLVVLITRSETANTPHDTESQTELISKIMKNENQEAAQNHMTSIVRLIPTQFRRRFTLPLALSIVLQGLSPSRNRPGFLGSIGTVHFARWIHLPKTNNYVFYSNYDGSFENYLEDFITKASIGLTGVWSHSVGFPKTRLLFLEGSEDGDRFKRYARGSMVPTPFWFSAYPASSADQIRKNALIRDGLARIDNSSDAEAWLDLFGSMTRPEHVIQNERVQSIMFSGGGYLKSGACLVVRSVDGSPENFKKWVEKVTPSITFGERSPREPTSYIAFGRDGLELLGLGDILKHDEPWDGRNELIGPPDKVKFPPAFNLGMDHETRRNILGDAGQDAPEHWNWGSGEKRSHAVLLVYAPNTSKTKTSNSQKNLKTLINKHKKWLKEYGLVCDQIDFEDIPDKGFGKEPFGFVDGISQPIMRGTKRGARTGESIHLVNPGEFILGYKDDRDYYPPSPQIGSHRDVEDDLPSTVLEQPQRYPKFEPSGDLTLRDLGRNGSFLVIRQLEQDHEEFQRVTKDIGKKLCPHDADSAQQVVQAKMMGRWHDGRSMAQNPVRIHRGDKGRLDFDYRKDLDPVSRPYNEFLFGEADPQGHDCPYGSHIRRSNPRDGLEPENENALPITNRHRILRRGRTFIDGNKKGTFFVCLNADLDRQFEFIQQTWVGSAKFHGLRDEVDPITAQAIHTDLERQSKKGYAPDDRRFTIQTAGQEIPITGLKSFVTMKGGGYFFLPSRDALRFLSRPA